MVADPVTTLLVSFALWFGRKNEEAAHQRQAVTAIRELGGAVRYDYEKSDAGHSNVFDPRKGPAAPTYLRQLFGEEFFRTVVKVSLRNKTVTDDDLALLKRFPRLENLDLTNTGITSAGVSHLRGLTKLRMLSLWKTEIDDDGLKHLAGMTALETLILDETLVTDAGLAHLERLANLDGWLGLTHTLVSDAGVKHLKGMEKLRNLNLRNTFVTRAGVADLQKSLPNADISFDIFADAAFEHRIPSTDLNVALRQQVAAVDRICRLTADQKQKLRLYGRLDIEQMHDGSEPAPRPRQIGPFGNGSRFIWFLEQRLTAEQVRRIEPFRPLLERGVHLQVWPDTPSGIRAVRLIGGGCTDETLAQLNSIPGLRLLVLHRTRVTDAGLRSLKNLTGLRELWIAGTKVDGGAAAELQQAVPGLKVTTK
jgi:hypothetical protein